MNLLLNIVVCGISIILLILGLIGIYWLNKKKKAFNAKLKAQTLPGGGDKEPNNSNRHIPDRVKIFVWRRDQGRCVKCGDNENLEYDHIIPVSKGGSNTERNLQLLCMQCNRSKGSDIV